MAQDMDRRLRGDIGSGNTFNGSTKLVMWILGIFAGAILLLGSWVGTTLVDLKADMREVKVDIKYLERSRHDGP